MNYSNSKEKDLFENYLRVANDAMHYALGMVDESSTHSRLPKNDVKIIFSKIKKMREEKNKSLDFQSLLQDYFEISDPSMKLLRKTKKSIKKHRVGNCGELAMLALIYCRKHNCPAERVSLSNADHSFIVINRLPRSDINDPDSWGEYAIICDPLAHQIYPAKYFREHLTGYRFDPNKEYPNIDIPYDEIDKPLFIVKQEKEKQSDDILLLLQNELQKKISLIKSLINELEIESNFKEIILQITNKFELNFYHNNENKSCIIIERLFHKMTKIIVRNLYEACQKNEEFLEDTVGSALLKLDHSNEGSPFLEKLILEGNIDYRDRLIYKNLSKDTLYNCNTPATQAWA